MKIHLWLNGKEISDEHLTGYAFIGICQNKGMLQRKTWL